ncbi:MAG TPA: sugar transferase [Candidatus Paceibacterota bacterium]|nr:sugar transferase [Candidatus Paceibacterota bacterium]
MINRRRFILLTGDAVAIAGAFIAVIFIRLNIIGDTIPATSYIGPFSSLLILWLITLFIFNFYDIEYIKPNPRNVGILAIASSINILVGGLVFYFFPQDSITPKLTLLIAGVSAFFLLIIWRRLFYKIFASISVSRIFVIGSSTSTEHFTEEVRRNPLIGKVVATFKEIDEDEITKATAQFNSPDIIVAETKELEKLITTTRNLGVKIMSIEEAYEDMFAKIPTAHLNENTAMQLATKRISFSNWIFKKIFDRFVAIVILIITSPILILASIAILIEDGGPIIYTQKRTGKNLDTFKLYKLRSMKKDAEKNGAQWADKKDSRITFVGRIIRKLHIDEIPQMYNILKGDLALVGPRPERPEFVENLEKQIPYYFLRHTIRPGFTGWAQIKFRYARTIDDSERKFEYDLYYIKNRGLIFDIGILFKTIQIIFTH